MSVSETGMPLTGIGPGKRRKAFSRPKPPSRPALSPNKPSAHRTNPARDYEKKRSIVLKGPTQTPNTFLFNHLQIDKFVRVTYLVLFQ
jgi:hypothetical protein